MRAEHWIYTIPLRLRSLFRRNRVEQELDEELQYHLEKKIEQFVERGMTPEQARYAALHAMDGLAQQQEQCRDARGVSLLEDCGQDLRFALRTMRKSPALTVVVVLSLALGIGANTAIFSLIDAVMLRMLPVERPQELYMVERQLEGGRGASSFTNVLWESVRDHQDMFSTVFAWSSWHMDLARGGAVQYSQGIYVSGNYFAGLGIRPAVGRLIEPADDQRGCAALAVLSYGFWQSHYGGSAGVVGSPISLNQQTFQVIGVSAPGFYGVAGGEKFDVAVPICASALFDGKRSRLDARSWWWLQVMGRVKPGISAQQLQARLAALSPAVMNAAIPTQWDPEHQKKFLHTALMASPAARGTSELRRQFGVALNILMVIVALVLLIACANIASLLLARATARGREIAIRKALGASRSRLMRQLLTESVLLSLLGALIGLLFARWGSALLVHKLTTTQTQVFLELSLDGPVLAFTIAIAVLTGILVGLLPAWRSTRASLISAMKGSLAASIEQRSQFRAGKGIIAVQVALCLVLLIGGGLLLRTFLKLLTLDLGFDRDHVLVVLPNLRAAHIPPENQEAMLEETEQKLRAVPGVSSVSRSFTTPLSGMEWNSVIGADVPNAPAGEDALVWFNSISPTYFQTMRIPLLAGRLFNQHDTKTSPLVAIVSETMARRFFPGVNALGHHLQVISDPRKPGPSIEIVGIVRDAKYEAIREATQPVAFIPTSQVPEREFGDAFELRSNLPAETLVPAVQQVFASVNKDVPFEFHTLTEQVDDNLVSERLLATLSGFFGGLALLLAMIGLYGTVAYTVAQRTSEIGIRMALGAQRERILGMVLRETAVIVAVGIAIGLPLAWIASRLLASQLFGLSPHDPATILMGCGALLAVTMAAGFIPARRASRVDPMVALRYE